MLNLGQLWLLTLLAPSGAYTTFQKLPIYSVKSTYQGANFATFSVYPCTTGVGHMQLQKPKHLGYPLGTPNLWGSVIAYDQLLRYMGVH